MNIFIICNFLLTFCLSKVRLSFDPELRDVSESPGAVIKDAGADPGCDKQSLDADSLREFLSFIDGWSEVTERFIPLVPPFETRISLFDSGE